MLSEQLIEWQPAGRVIFGRGEISWIGELVQDLGAAKVFLVSDPGIAASGLLDVVRAGLDEDIPVGSFEDVNPSPATGDIEAGSAALREFGVRDTVVVAVGGGSSLDAAKGIALHAANELPVAGLDFMAEGVRAGAPIIAVPTTAGTGSETNHFGVVTDPAGPKKIYIEMADFARTICIPTPGVHTTDFDLSRERKLELYEAGHTAAQRVLQTWSFEGYKKEFRRNEGRSRTEEAAGRMRRAADTNLTHPA